MVVPIQLLVGFGRLLRFNFKCCYFSGGWGEWVGVSQIKANSVQLGLGLSLAKKRYYICLAGVPLFLACVFYCCTVLGTNVMLS